MKKDNENGKFYRNLAEVKGHDLKDYRYAQRAELHGCGECKKPKEADAQKIGRLSLESTEDEQGSDWPVSDEEKMVQRVTWVKAEARSC